MLHRKGQKRYWTDWSLLGQEPTFTELPGYLIMPLPEIANDKKKTRMYFFFILNSLLYRNCYQKKMKRFYLQII